jgi:hypothetical protein
MGRWGWLRDCTGQGQGWATRGSHYAGSSPWQLTTTGTTTTETRSRGWSQTWAARAGHAAIGSPWQDEEVLKLDECSNSQIIDLAKVLLKRSPSTRWGRPHAASCCWAGRRGRGDTLRSRKASMPAGSSGYRWRAHRWSRGDRRWLPVCTVNDAYLAI